ncbi:MAG: DUF489 family protein [Succinivibrio sp.]|nr:DUF489 family protein [Succinivibrio sp.]
MKNIRSESIALAALFQCCSQINRIAHSGYCDEQAVSTVFRALLVTNPDTIDDIYKESNLKIGFKSLIEGFSTDGITDNTAKELAKLAMQVMSLTDRIMGNSSLYNRLSNEIDSMKIQIEKDYPDFLEGSTSVVMNSDNVEKFAQLYQSLISPNFSKLLIFGEERFLSSTENQNRIRALLLAGIRALVLWNQVGGKKLYLVFRRKDILSYASEQI